MRIRTIWCALLCMLSISGAEAAMHLMSAEVTHHAADQLSQPVDWSKPMRPHVQVVSWVKVHQESVAPKAQKSKKQVLKPMPTEKPVPHASKRIQKAHKGVLQVMHVAKVPQPVKTQHHAAKKHHEEHKCHETHKSYGATHAKCTVPQKKKIKQARRARLLRWVLQDGSLKDNVDALLQKEKPWRLVWKPHYDYHWVGHEVVLSASLQSVLEKVLKAYPLKATLYHGNHVVVIASKEEKSS